MGAADVVLEMVEHGPRKDVNVWTRSECGCCSECCCCERTGKEKWSARRLRPPLVVEEMLLVVVILLVDVGWLVLPSLARYKGGSSLRISYSTEYIEYLVMQGLTLWLR